MKIIFKIAKNRDDDEKWQELELPTQLPKLLCTLKRQNANLRKETEPEVTGNNIA